MNTDSYEIDAKAEQSSSRAQLNGMFQTLLADRFRLQLHREAQELPVYALVIDEEGSKLKPNDTVDEFDGRIGPNMVNPRMGGLPGMTAVGVPISELCWSLSQILALPVTDETGLKGFYDFKSEYGGIFNAGVPQVPTDGGEPPPAAGPSIFDAPPGTASFTVAGSSGGQQQVQKLLTKGCR
jgi:uncharacterized protein (TIGR03435 family)